jgi:hypothetical protein
MHDEGGFETKLGMSPQQIAGIARETFMLVLHVEPLPATDAILEKWQDALAPIFDAYVERAPVAWSKLTATVAQRFGDAWDDLPAAKRVAWQAAVRTAVNWCVAADAEDRQEIEMFDWDEWAREKLIQELGNE